MTPQTFWMVWVSHKSAPTKRHPSPMSARDEAARLACLPDNRGKKVYVLMAREYCETVPPIPPVSWHNV